MPSRVFLGPDEILAAIRRAFHKRSGVAIEQEISKIVAKYRNLITGAS